MEDKDGKQVREKGLGGDQADSYARYGVPANWYNWSITVTIQCGQGTQ